MSAAPEVGTVEAEVPSAEPPSRRTTALRIGVACVGAAPAVGLRLAGVHLEPVPGMVVFGIGVLAAALLLMWAAETARADISGPLALALLAFIAVLPEYAVDLYFAYTAGSKPEYAAYAAANMTGANRLLVGVGWPLVALAAYFSARRAGKRPGIVLREHRRIDVAFLGAAALFAFVMPLTREISWVVAVVLIAWYGSYLYRIGRCSETDEEELVGVPARLAQLPAGRRKLTTVCVFLVAAGVVFACAEPFATSLVDAGASLGIDRFLLVQWLAPLASEAPELIVAVVFAWRLRADDGLGALLSSKVNQWTLLIACLPLAYGVGGGGWSLPLVERQVDEVMLTAAQTVLAVVLLLDLRFLSWKAGLLFGLFVVQFVLPGENARLALSYVYLALAVVLLTRKWAELKPTAVAVTGRVEGDPH
ncbi:sodium:proton exchanger [Kitasatospora sp. MMS16-BH015]|uniref:sodium:proton exchanger n=1 Tax=Kitasatospora sp. MMS16-BH015 TaxID=2018025 RepID=UPI000CA350C3|nr:sodium:proton exchanger [Kitasatospora sp. MMS16-BH015]AUG77255.1 sodium:proton exchanger [Kitasatospora sp. MMS16-BH015]